jgi:D-alanyl-D-alanine endopeptidase (penicillin-binding protein 7)
MNLWSLVSTILLSLGVITSPFYYLPSLELITKDNSQNIVITKKPLDDNKIIPHKIDSQSWGVKISAQAAAVMDKNTGLILWQKNATAVRPLASITKLMTALVFLANNPGWETAVVMAEADEVNGASNNLMRNETVTVEDLFNLALVGSDNNAARALVRSTSLPEEDFIKLMNKKAQELGLTKTVFKEVTGLSEANVSTALDILTLAKTAFTKEEIKQATTKKSYNLVTKEGRVEKIVSTNHLLNSYLNISAGKTGYITASGYCLVAQVNGEQGQEIITVVLGSVSNADRFYDLKVLAAWILQNFSWS